MPKKKQESQTKPRGETTGAGGETHQTTSAKNALTTNQGTPIADNQNSLRVGARGPTLLEDFILREKITHFDHERIPERVVHARGYGAHGYFVPFQDNGNLTKASFLRTPKVKTPVFVRFSTVAGSEGSADTARDVRGFAVKFYTKEGNFDLVGNNIPVFFIQDAIKFPDLVHSVKPAQDRGFPQAQSAHDSFWDFVSLMPESMNMLMWVMSDRAIPRSFRMMEGFGVHTFRMINDEGKSTFVKFHWRPKLGAHSLVWDEALKLGGADPDFHRRDLWNAIESGNFPEYDFGVQAFDQKTADSFDFDVLDPTKIIPEEIVPITVLGKMVLDRNVDEFFAETEQVAFCPSHLVPGIDFTNDPLLQGRVFSYLDTQLSRLGSANFHEIPVNKPQCPFRNLQRGGHMRMTVSRGRTANEPNSLDEGHPRETPEAGFSSFPAKESGETLRIRAESFADHYSQARQFWHSMTTPEQNHIADAFTFELGKVEMPHIRTRMLGHLNLIEPELGKRVAEQLGMPNSADVIQPAKKPKKLASSPSLSLISKAPESLDGKKIGVLVTNGVDAKLTKRLQQAAKQGSFEIAYVAPSADGIQSSAGDALPIDQALTGGPSVLFDACIVAADPDKLSATMQRTAAHWLSDAFAHLKFIGFTQSSMPLLDAAQVAPDAIGVVNVGENLNGFLDDLRTHRAWDRETAS